MANGAALTLGPVRLVARWSLRSADHAGRFTFLLVDMLRGLAEWRIYLPRTFEQSLAVGYGSLFIVLLVAGFAGAVTSLQTGYQFTGALPLYYAGAVIAESVVLELGPVLTGLILAGRIGARYAAELGTMRVTEQIDALESLGRSPVSHLLLPRVIAGLLVIPALTMFANATGIVVGYLTAKGSLDLTYGDFEYGARYFFRTRDHDRGGGRVGREPDARRGHHEAAAGGEMIELLDVHKRFVENVVLDGVSLEVKDGETVALLGPSGVGKSVTLKMINGLLRPDAGDVIVDGLHVPQLGRKELATLRGKIGYVFQYGALFDSMSVAENIRLGITDETCYNDEKFCENRIQECLRLVNLAADVAAKLPAELSGGMKKRVGIARAIAGQPKYLLYDEPTSGLDPVNADVIDGLIERLRDELGVTSVVVSHDVRGSFRVADRVALLWQAKIRVVGPPDQILASKDPAVLQFLERDLEMTLIQAEGVARGRNV